MTRLLAHEMGHALGMDHIPDAKAVMYKIPTGADLKAAAADLSELDRVCRRGFFSNSSAALIRLMSIGKPPRAQNR